MISHFIAYIGGMSQAIEPQEPAAIVEDDSASDLLSLSRAEILYEVQGDLAAHHQSTFDIARHLWQVKHHELWKPETEADTPYESYHDWLTAGVGVGKDMARTTGYALPNAFAAAMEVSAITGKPAREIWDTIGRTKLELVPLASDEIKADLISAAQSGATRNALQQMLAEDNADDEPTPDELPPEPADDEEPTPTSDDLPPELDAIEMARVSGKVPLGRDQYGKILDLATLEPMVGRSFDQIPQGMISIPLGSHELQIVMTALNGRIKGFIYRWTEGRK